MNEWETVIEHQSGAFENNTYRLKIPEGWLYRYGSQLVFVPTRYMVMDESGKLTEVEKAA